VIGLLRRLARVRRLDHGEEATLVEHLTELRDRLISCFVLAAVVFAVAFWRYHDLFQILNGPLPHKLKESKPITTEIGEAFTLTILISAYTAILITFPFTLYQLYSYLIPAFSQDAAKKVRPMLLFVPLLFTAGAIFGYYVVVPSAVRFLYFWASDEVTALPRAKSIYPFEMTMMFVMGIIFEMPAAVWVLARLHVLHSRVMKKNRRVAIVVLAIIAAALPGTDPVSMLLELAPLLVLYEVSIWVARGVERGRIVVDEAIEKVEEVVEKVTGDDDEQ
jgi:sec-independent protein translocase protein TatC